MGGTSSTSPPLFQKQIYATMGELGGLPRGADCIAAENMPWELQSGALIRTLLEGFLIHLLFSLLK